MADALDVNVGTTPPVSIHAAFIVGRRETMALIGPSGAGKSTILRVIAGLERARSGHVRCGNQVWFDDRANIDLPASRRRVGLVAQSYALFPHLTAAGNVMEAMQDRLRASREAAAENLLRQVHLDGLGGRRPSELSGGQQQRVALARALARDPEVLLLDEPFSAVDRPTRRALHRLLAELRSRVPIPILFVTHDIEDAETSADSLGFVRGGRLIETMRTGELDERRDSQLAAWLAG